MSKIQGHIGLFILISLYPIFSCSQSYVDIGGQYQHPSPEKTINLRTRLITNGPLKDKFNIEEAFSPFIGYARVLRDTRRLTIAHSMSFRSTVVKTSMPRELIDIYQFEQADGTLYYTYHSFNHNRYRIAYGPQLEAPIFSERMTLGCAFSVDMLSLIRTQRVYATCTETNWERLGSFPQVSGEYSVYGTYRFQETKYSILVGYGSRFNSLFSNRYRNVSLCIRYNLKSS